MNQLKRWIRAYHRWKKGGFSLGDKISADFCHTCHFYQYKEYRILYHLGIMRNREKARRRKKKKVGLGRVDVPYRKKNITFPKTKWPSISREEDNGTSNRGYLRRTVGTSNKVTTDYGVWVLVCTMASRCGCLAPRVALPSQLPREWLGNFVRNTAPGVVGWGRFGDLWAKLCFVRTHFWLVGKKKNIRNVEYEYVWRLGVGRRNKQKSLVPR